VKQVLVALAIAQAAILLATFGFLVFNRWLDARRTAARRAERQRLLAALQAALVSDGAVAAFAETAAASSFTAVALVLHDHATQMHGEQWETLMRALRQPAAVEETLHRYVRSRLWWRRAVGARVLALAARADDLPMVRDLIADSRPAVKLAAITAVRRLKHPELLESVLDEAVRARRVMRGYMMATLASVGAPLVPVLAARLAAPRSVFELRDLIKLSGTIAAPELLDPVLRFADHSDPEVRGAVARSLGGFPDSRAHHVLLRLISDDAWQVRTRAATALGTLGVEQAQGALEKAVADGNWWVRLRAALALRQLGEAGVRTLNRLERGPDRFASEMARYTLQLTDAALMDHLA
jgi:HEAT repeat protein